MGCDMLNAGRPEQQRRLLDELVSQGLRRVGVVAADSLVEGWRLLYLKKGTWRSGPGRMGVIEGVVMEAPGGSVWRLGLDGVFRPGYVPAGSVGIQPEETWPVS